MNFLRKTALAGIGTYCGIRFKCAQASSVPDRDPLQLMRQWWRESQESKVDYTDAMFLSTVSIDGQPSCRSVLCKEIGDDFSVKFHTHSTSQKGRDLEANPKASALFFWRNPERQVRIEGYVERVPNNEVQSYWANRPRISQLGAHASKQSEPLTSRDELLQRVRYFDEKYPTQIPKPENWCGYRLVALKVEFWQNGEHRLHDRWQFTRSNVSTAWSLQRLHP
eukprot:TRINITY_DN10230_c0_g2_i1.p1 TRINITY_DN10230_c0_g2~~TRINITY_DN10230_c0_g2_i1.p1  ORF type:complete len:223 (+),score=35.61 TRINITY_DN10230_c0_g2_i1:124-792(+)